MVDSPVLKNWLPGPSLLVDGGLTGLSGARGRSCPEAEVTTVAPVIVWPQSPRATELAWGLGTGSPGRDELIGIRFPLRHPAWLS